MNAKYFQITQKNHINNVWNPEVAFNKVVQTEILPQWGSDILYAMWFNNNTNGFQFRQGIKVTFACDFDFTSYPFDEHDCNMDFGTASQAINSGMNFAPIHSLSE